MPELLKNHLLIVHKLARFEMHQRILQNRNDKLQNKLRNTSIGYDTAISANTLNGVTQATHKSDCRLVQWYGYALLVLVVLGDGRENELPQLLQAIARVVSVHEYGRRTGKVLYSAHARHHDAALGLLQIAEIHGTIENL
jgi:hypothetical protein